MATSILVSSAPAAPASAYVALVPNSEAAQIIKIAKAQLGDPWRYGAMGPYAFDCSGLVLYSFKQAGDYSRRGLGQVPLGEVDLLLVQEPRPDEPDQRGSWRPRRVGRRQPHRHLHRQRLRDQHAHQRRQGPSGQRAYRFVHRVSPHGHEPLGSYAPPFGQSDPGVPQSPGRSISGGDTAGARQLLMHGARRARLGRSTRALPVFPRLSHRRRTRRRGGRATDAANRPRGAPAGQLDRRQGVDDPEAREYATRRPGRAPR